jgi:hypothetical protein
MILALPSPPYIVPVNHAPSISQSPFFVAQCTTTGWRLVHCGGQIFQSVLVQKDSDGPSQCRRLMSSSSLVSWSVVNETDRVGTLTLQFSHHVLCIDG